MTFRDDIKKIDFKGDATIDVIDQICQAAERMADTAWHEKSVLSAWRKLRRS